MTTKPYVPIKNGSKWWLARPTGEPGAYDGFIDLTCAPGEEQLMAEQLAESLNRSVLAAEATMKERCAKVAEGELSATDRVVQSEIAHRIRALD